MCWVKLIIYKKTALSKWATQLLKLMSRFQHREWTLNLVLRPTPGLVYKCTLLNVLKGHKSLSLVIPSQAQLCLSPTVKISLAVKSPFTVKSQASPSHLLLTHSARNILIKQVFLSHNSKDLFQSLDIKPLPPSFLQPKVGTRSDRLVSKLYWWSIPWRRMSGLNTPFQTRPPLDQKKRTYAGSSQP
jgi:hypothetical protein